MRVVPPYIDPCANIGYGRLQVLGSGAPDKSRKAIWGSNSVDGAAGTLGPDCDAGRGGVVDAGGESGGRGLLVLEATGRSDKRRLISTDGALFHHPKVALDVSQKKGGVSQLEQNNIPCGVSVLVFCNFPVLAKWASS